MGKECDVAVQVQAVTNAATPIVNGFEDRVLTSPTAINILQAVTDTPLVDTTLEAVANATEIFAPFLRTATVCPCQLI